jgi:hypothetical protein
MAEMGFVHSAPPIVVRKSSDAGSFGWIEWCSHS